MVASRPNVARQRIVDRRDAPTYGYLANDGNNTNVTIQSQCWARYVDHISIALDGTVYSGIQDALAHRSIGLNCFAL